MPGIPCFVDGQGRVFRLLPYEENMIGFKPYEKIEDEGNLIIIVADSAEDVPADEQEPLD